eukprot:5632602-Amphidinium_carterae.1
MAQTLQQQHPQKSFKGFAKHLSPFSNNPRKDDSNIDDFLTAAEEQLSYAAVPRRDWVGLITSHLFLGSALIWFKNWKKEQSSAPSYDEFRLVALRYFAKDDSDKILRAFECCEQGSRSTATYIQDFQDQRNAILCHPDSQVLEYYTMAQWIDRFKIEGPCTRHPHCLDHQGIQGS